MLQVGDKFPEFCVMANTKLGTTEDSFESIDSSMLDGKWTVFFSWPLDFTFVCPTEISAMGECKKKFDEANAQVFGMSCDSHFCHLAWRKDNHKIGEFPYPMLADYKREISTALGIVDQATGAPQRVTVVVDPKRIIRFFSVTDLNVGRNTEEVVRVLDALQNGGLCPVNWKKGDPTL